MSEPSRATKPSALSATTSSSSSTSSVNWTVDQMNPRGKLQVAPSTGPAVIVIVILIVLTLILGVSWFGARQFRKVQRKQAAQTQKQDHDSNPETYLYRKPDLGVGALRQELAILPAIKNRFSDLEDHPQRNLRNMSTSAGLSACQVFRSLLKESVELRSPYQKI